jgi:hypothetical protein
MALGSSIWLIIAIMARTHAIPMPGREEAELSTACDKASTSPTYPRRARTRSISLRIRTCHPCCLTISKPDSRILELNKTTQETSLTLSAKHRCIGGCRRCFVLRGGHEVLAQTSQLSPINDPPSITTSSNDSSTQLLSSNVGSVTCIERRIAFSVDCKLAEMDCAICSQVGRTPQKQYARGLRICMHACMQEIRIL